MTSQLIVSGNEAIGIVRVAISIHELVICSIQIAANVSLHS